jgi:hypothetical protein
MSITTLATLLLLAVAPTAISSTQSSAQHDAVSDDTIATAAAVSESDDVDLDGAVDNATQSSTRWPFRSGYRLTIETHFWNTVITSPTLDGLMTRTGDMMAWIDPPLEELKPFAWCYEDTYTQTSECGVDDPANHPWCEGPDCDIACCILTIVNEGCGGCLDGE